MSAGEWQLQDTDKLLLNIGHSIWPWNVFYPENQVILLCKHKNYQSHCSQIFRCVVCWEELSQNWKLKKGSEYDLYCDNLQKSRFLPILQVTILQGNIKLKCTLCLLGCLIFASEIWQNIMSNNFMGIFLKHFYHMKLKDVQKEMVAIPNAS